MQLSKPYPQLSFTDDPPPLFMTAHAASANAPGNVNAKIKRIKYRFIIMLSFVSCHWPKSEIPQRKKQAYTQSCRMWFNSVEPGLVPGRPPPPPLPTVRKYSEYCGASAKISTACSACLVRGQSPSPDTWLYAIAALAGAAIGTAIGLRWLSQAVTRYVLAAILATAGLQLLLF
jgi:hypothetical protein